MAAETTRSETFDVTLVGHGRTGGGVDYYTDRTTLAFEWEHPGGRGLEPRGVVQYAYHLGRVPSSPDSQTHMTGKHQTPITPIDIGTFERGSEFDGSETRAERIIGFFARNDGKAFERGETADATGTDVNAVSTVLPRLEDRELVRHGPPYWALGGRDRLAAATNPRRSPDALNDGFGAEDVEEWRAAGTDDLHPNDRESEVE